MPAPASPLSGSSILVVEDEPLLRKKIAAHLESLGADVTTVDEVGKARRTLEDLSFDFALIDVNLPDGRGTDLLAEGAFPKNTGVVVMTAEGGPSGAVEAMKLGALDYLVKPFEVEELPLVMSRAKKARQSSRLEEFKKQETPQSFYFGASLSFLEDILEKILAADRRLQSNLSPVLIEGETGTGKTTIARWIHRQGPRASQPLVEVNCSALPETLAESELFGHERGAFTDARSARMGLFEAAAGGTLFLDELPSLSAPLQAKVLTAIEDRRVRCVGGNKEIPVDVRIIAATNLDLKEAVAEGRFREDLYHRLDLFRVSIPPLRDRGDDILTLAESLLAQLCRRHRLDPKTLSAEGRKRALAYPWPGNVRELAHELERSLIFEEEAALNLARLAAVNQPSAGAPNPDDWFNHQFVFPPQGFSLDDAINRVVRHALNQTNNNVSGAARLLGVTRDYVRYRLANERPSQPDEAT